jgi:MFS family permease
VVYNAGNAGEILFLFGHRSGMTFYFVVAMTVLNHIAYKGSKMLVSLYAIDFGGTPFEVGILFSLYSIFSLFIAVHVGRWSDRVGPRRLMLIGCFGLGAGTLHLHVHCAVDLVPRRQHALRRGPRPPHPVMPTFFFFI